MADLTQARLYVGPEEHLDPGIKRQRLENAQAVGPVSLGPDPSMTQDSTPGMGHMMGQDMAGTMAQSMSSSMVPGIAQGVVSLQSNMGSNIPTFPSSLVSTVQTMGTSTLNSAMNAGMGSTMGPGMTGHMSHPSEMTMGQLLQQNDWQMQQGQTHMQHAPLHMQHQQAQMNYQAQRQHQAALMPHSENQMQHAPGQMQHMPSQLQHQAAHLQSQPQHMMNAPSLVHQQQLQVQQGQPQVPQQAPAQKQNASKQSTDESNGDPSQASQHTNKAAKAATGEAIADTYRHKSRRKASEKPKGPDQIRQAFSKRKRGLALKAYQLFKITDSKVFFFIMNDKGSSWAYATPGFGAALNTTHLQALRALAGDDSGAKGGISHNGADAAPTERGPRRSPPSHARAGGCLARGPQYMAAPSAHEPGHGPRFGSFSWPEYGGFCPGPHACGWHATKSGCPCPQPSVPASPSKHGQRPISR
eukprot:jgi/Botrbrau1/20880/Bobra.0135s0013.2